ncbi:LOW QUALITY PROTEIN: short transient receptor potential channel 2-like [Cyclopterus lumpus]|uniref:LOW QUALITY PROTEIN: short transient receptor potential channel 2-like n=1 Tax=Cyclopterus lumpus TaxID=8103 RepID=UPI0014866E43|nr:LOW QUALITY PROTEIN: short transient receptor potential channel 2-like [Cyclopterus lumpus]
MEKLTPEQWREIMNKKMRFPPELIGAIQEGKIELLSGLLKTGDGILRQLDESEDRQWREALNLSIRLGNESCMDALLQGVKFDFRQIHEALLVAVDTNQPRVVKRLLDRLDQEKGNKMDVRSFSQAIFDHSIDNSQFAPGVTPLTLACQKDLYDIVAMLTQKGHIIPWPHKISCSCLECRNGRQYDLLKFSLSRINTYRGIASRAYLSVTSDDAMLRAFTLSRELRKLSKKEPEFKPQYLGLEELCQEFAVELLGMCRNQSEVTTILNSCGDESQDSLEEQAFEEGIPNLSRLRLAVNYNQKQFVAHPICQQVLSSIWCGNLSGWRGSRTAWKLFISVGIFFTMPFLCLIYWIAPKSKVGKILKTPVIKFLLHSASYLWFLITLLGESITMEMYKAKFASRTQDILHSSFHMVWVVGFFWYECKEVWIEGLRSYFLDWWNCLDVMVLSMYLASFALRVLIVLKGYFLCHDYNGTADCIYFTKTERQDWHQEDPQLIAEVLFAVTSMLSFTRLAYILPAHESLGTLQISIGKMIDDMMRFMFILMIIGTAFLCGINNVYVPYVISPHLGRFNETFHFLFWTMFGVANQEYVDMQQYVLAEFVGRVLYGIFTLVIVIVLLNMLIAMITNTFQKIEDDADVEWKFARSKLYLSYFREGLTIPVPFNIIPSPKAVFYILKAIFRKICCCCTSNSEDRYPALASMTNDKGSEDSPLPYRQQVIRALVQRYIESARREFEETKRKDIGNRITLLTKVVTRMHSDMKVVHQVLIDGHPASDALTKDGSSFLGKYITGAKNNFIGFNSRHDDTNTSLKVTVHHGEEGVDKEKLDSDTKQESDAQQNEASECSAGGSKPVTDCDVLKMEEGRAQIEPGDEKETEKKEQVEADKNEVKEGVVAGTSFNHGGEKQKTEAPQDEAEKRREGETLTVGKVCEKQTETTSQQAERIKAKWMKGRTCEHDGAEKSGFRESDAKPGAKKTIPSPTGSGSSQDTGFGSQEGQGSLDGTSVRP